MHQKRARHIDPCPNLNKLECTAKSYLFHFGMTFSNAYPKHTTNTKTIVFTQLYPPLCFSSAPRNLPGTCFGTGTDGAVEDQIAP